MLQTKKSQIVASPRKLAQQQLLWLEIIVTPTKMDPFAMFTFLVITLPVEIRLLMAIADSLNLPRLGKLIVVPFGLAMIM